MVSFLKAVSLTHVSVSTPVHTCVFVHLLTLTAVSWRGLGYTPFWIKDASVHSGPSLLEGLVYTPYWSRDTRVYWEGLCLCLFLSISLSQRELGYTPYWSKDTMCIQKVSVSPYILFFKAQCKYCLWNFCSPVQETVHMKGPKGSSVHEVE